MRRREFVTLLGSAAAAWPFAAQSQQNSVRTIGVLMGTSELDSDERALISVLTQTLATLGWKDGSDIHIETRWAGGDIARLDGLASELAHLAPSVIVTQGTPTTIAVRRAAPSTPVVFINVSDPVSTGLVSSLAHPGGNITGFTNFDYSIGAKWLSILKEIAPYLTHVTVLFNPDNPIWEGWVRAVNSAGSKLGIEIETKPARNPGEFEQAITASASKTNVGLLVLLDFVTLAHRDLIVDLAARYRLPAGYGRRDFVASGGLYSYGVDPNDLFRRAASYVDLILKGTKPADLPIQEPTRFELIVNLKTAKALGLTVPTTLLVTADEVIE
jgi:putative tryptophan/tyrosine transport system substrate-binding protein